MNLDALNPMQRKAAETLHGPVLILAGAGSGKTRTLTYRVANLLSHGVSAWHILALTFTNKAAREMKERIGRLVGEAVAEEAWIGTFHSTCCRILRRDIDKLGYERSFTIYDDDDQARVIKAVLKELNIDDKFLPAKEITAKISDAKNGELATDETAELLKKLIADDQLSEKSADEEKEKLQKDLDAVKIRITKAEDIILAKSDLTKNELALNAESEKEKSLKEVQELMKQFNFNPTLYNLLKNDNLI